MASPLRIVVIGNGIAGTMTAAKLRQLEPDPDRLRVEIYSREPFEYYSRIRLPEVFSSRLNAEDLKIYKADWYAGRHIDVFKNQEVVRIDRAARRIRMRSGAEVPYDELVLCMGADSYKPPIGNLDLDGVFTIREYGDADALRSYLTAGTRHAVVIGGGLLGLEAARFIQVPGVETVTVVELFPRLLPRQLDETGSKLLVKLVERQGCRIILGVQVLELLGQRQVQGLRLADGRQLPAQTVLISAGISPRVSMAREAGLEVKRGVVVDEHLRTSDPHIWAAGDLVDFQGIVWGIIPAALDHAPVVAGNILGGGLSYRQTIPQNTLKVAGINVTSIGKVVLEHGEADRFGVVERLQEENSRYEKYVLEDGVLAGCILLGSRENFSFAMQRIGKPVTRDEAAARLEWK